MLHLDLEQLHIRGSLILAPRIRGFVRHLTITQYEHYMTHVNLLTYDSSLTRNDRDKCGSDLVHDNIELRRSRKSLSTLAFWGSLHRYQIRKGRQLGLLRLLWACPIRGPFLHGSLREWSRDLEWHGWNVV